MRREALASGLIAAVLGLGSASPEGAAQNPIAEAQRHRQEATAAHRGLGVQLQGKMSPGTR
jgi:hypothetical protein